MLQAMAGAGVPAICRVPWNDETEAAVNNLDEILAVPEIDGIYIGPADLNLSRTRRS